MSKLEKVIDWTLGSEIPQEYECPKCGAVQSAWAITITGFPPYDGRYCQKCWAKWIAEHCGKLEEKGKQNVD